MSDGQEILVPETAERFRKRNELIIRHKLAGLSVHTITRDVNRHAALGEWRAVSTRQVFRVIADYYRESKADAIEDMDEELLMREALKDQISMNIEKLSIYIANRDKDRFVLNPKTGKKDKKIAGIPWKSFEYAKALETLHKMQVDLAEINNWIYGRTKNPVNQRPLSGIDYHKTAALIDSAPEQVKQTFINSMKAAAEEMRRVEAGKYDVTDPPPVYSELGDSVVEMPVQEEEPNTLHTNEEPSTITPEVQQPKNLDNGTQDVFDGL